jgi:hypothetical protein
MNENHTDCPRCGQTNAPDSRFCNKCGNPLVTCASGSAAYPHIPQSASAKSIIALILGILSIVMFGFLSGIPAMILAKHEEDEIRRGRSPVAGEMLAKLGFWLGLIGTILSGLAVLFFIMVLFLGIGLPLFFI